MAVNLDTKYLNVVVLGGDEEKMLDAGCDGFILKPISVLSFMETIDRFVADQGPNPAKCELETA